MRGLFRDVTVRSPRYWLALCYVLATVLVQGVHVHGPEDPAKALARHEAGCSDPRPHVAGHEAPDLSHAAEHCPACQFRADHHVLPFARPEFFRPCVALPTRADGRVGWTTTSLGHTCRAPPSRETA